MTTAGVNVPSYYSKFFADNMKNVNISDLMRGAGGPGGGDA